MRVQLRAQNRLTLVCDWNLLANPNFGARPPAACSRCGCKLSRYRPLGDTHCAPCQTSLHEAAEA